MVKAAAVVTGPGRELQSLIDGMYFGEIPDFALTAVIGAEADSPVMNRARGAGIAVNKVDPRLFPGAPSYTRALTALLADLDVDAVILADVSPEPAEPLFRAFAGRCLRLKYCGAEAEVSLLDADGSYRAGEVPAGTTLTPMATDAAQYFYFILDDGREGRVVFERREYEVYIDGVSENEYFEELMYAG